MANAVTTSLDKLRRSGFVDLLSHALLARLGRCLVRVALVGVADGAILGLDALGYTLVSGILQLINFAHGDVLALSGLVADTVVVDIVGLTQDIPLPAIIGGLLVTLLVILALSAVV